MTNASAFIWPLLGFLTVAALASWWQAHSSKREIEAMEQQFVRDRTSRDKLEDIRRFQRTRERRAAVLGAIAFAAMIYLELV